MFCSFRKFWFIKYLESSSQIFQNPPKCNNKQRAKFTSLSIEVSCKLFKNFVYIFRVHKIVEKGSRAEKETKNPKIIFKKTAHHRRCLYIMKWESFRVLLLNKNLFFFLCLFSSFSSNSTMHYVSFGIVYVINGWNLWLFLRQIHVQKWKDLLPYAYIPLNNLLLFNRENSAIIHSNLFSLLVYKNKVSLFTIFFFLIFRSQIRFHYTVMKWIQRQ